MFAIKKVKMKFIKKYSSVIILFVSLNVLFFLDVLTEPSHGYRIVEHCDNCGKDKEHLSNNALSKCPFCGIRY